MLRQWLCPATLAGPTSAKTSDNCQHEASMLRTQCSVTISSGAATRQMFDALTIQPVLLVEGAEPAGRAGARRAAGGLHRNERRVQQEALELPRSHRLGRVVVMQDLHQAEVESGNMRGAGQTKPRSLIAPSKTQGILKRAPNGITE